MSHLSADQLSALADGALGANARAEAERHVASCAACREALAELVSQDEALAVALAHDPGEAYFDTFAARVEDRLRAEGLAGAQGVQETRGLADWFRSPRKLAWMGGLAVLVVGAGIVLMTSREIGDPALRDSKFALRGDQVAQAPPSTTTPSGSGLDAKEKDAATTDARTRAADAPPMLGAPAPTPGTVRVDGERRLTESSRAREVRRNELGEDVPVRSEQEFHYAPPPPAETQAARPGPGAAVRVRKPTAAEPLSATAARESSGVLAKRDVAPAPVGATAPSVQEGTGDTRMFGLTSQNRAALESGTGGRVFETLPAYPRSIARNAQRLTAVAERLKAATGYDAAAAEWSRLLGHVKGGSLELETRWQIAVARYRAWEASPNPTRATNAAEALTAYIANAPPGGRRDDATRWLERVKR